MKVLKQPIIQKIIAMLVVFVMAMGYSQYLSYAIDLFTTNSNNVQFKAYFKSGDEEIAMIDSSIDANDLKLAIDIAVKNEGYLDGQISLENAGFKFKEDSKNDYIEKIENNVIYLKQINADEIAKIEVGIEYLNQTEIPLSSLNNPTKVKLGGTYFSSKPDIQIDGESEVLVNWKTPEGAKAELRARPLTNSIYKVNEKDKKIVQILVASKITNNSYPIKNTDLEMTLPEGTENVTVNKRWTTATNGNKDFSEQNYKVENGILKIKVDNNEVDGKISWHRDTQDIYVVTYQLPKNADLTNTNIIVNGKITTYDETILQAEEQKIELKETLDGIASIAKKEKENSIYKGKIYTGEKREYSYFTRVYVDYAIAVQNLKIYEGDTKFVTPENYDKQANTEYKKIKFNKDNVSHILGNIWTITIEDQNKNIKAITNDTETNEDGYIIVELEDGTKSINIDAGKPINNGILQMETTKAIVKTKYSREEIKEFREIKDSSDLAYIKTDEKTTTSRVESTVKLEETSSRASLNINKNKLVSNTTNKNVEIVAKLDANEEKLNLYKEPSITLTFPKEITKIKVQQAKGLYENGVEIDNYKLYKREDGIWQIYMKYKGEQKKYTTNGGTEIHLYLDVDVANLKEDKTGEITLNYTNENDGTNATIKAETAFEALKINTEARKKMLLNAASSQETNVEPQRATLADNVETQIKVLRGDSQINETDNVHEGETLKYKITIANNSNTDCDNISVKAIQTNGKLFKPEIEEMYNQFDSKTSNQTWYRLTDSNEISFDKIEKLKAGESITLTYEAVVDMLEGNNDKKVYGTINITSEDARLNNSIKTIENSISLAEAQILLTETLSREDMWKTESIARIKVDVKNLTQQELKNAEIKFTLSKEFDCDEDCIQYNVFKDEEEDEVEDFVLKNIQHQENGETIVTVELPSILRNGKTTIYLVPTLLETNKDGVNTKIMAKLETKSGNQYYSNSVEREAKGVKNRDIQINQKAYVKGQEVTQSNRAKDGDEIELVTNIKNNSDSDTIISISTGLIMGLEPKDVIIIKNGNETKYTDSIDEKAITLHSEIQAGETITMKIKILVEEDYLNVNQFISNITVYDVETLRIYKSEETIYIETEKNDEDDTENGDTENNDSENNNDPENNNNSEINSNEYEISGTAWIDRNKNGKMETTEKVKSNVEVQAIDTGTGKLINVTTKTGEDGTYTLKLEKGKYIVLFQYDTNTYDLTTYRINGVSEDINSDAVSKTLAVDGKQITVGVTDELELESNISGINIGLIEKENFDLKLEKYVSKVVVSNKEGTKTKQFKQGSIPKVEIRGKYLSGSVVLIEYTFKVTNIGQTTGTVGSIIDNMPSNLKYKSNLNSDWYKKGSNLYNESLAEEIIKPGESKEVKLILTKTMTASNTGLVANTANMEKVYSLNNTTDRDSTNNKAEAELIISVSTGEVNRLIVVSIIITCLIGIGAYIVVKRYINSNF